MNPALAANQTHPAILFGLVVKELGAKTTASLITCGLTHVYKQAADPQTNGELRASIFEKTRKVLLATMEKNPGLARRIADFFCRACDGHFTPNSYVKSDKSTLPEELLDNIEALAEYTKVMQDKTATEEDKAAAKRILLEEIEQDWDLIGNSR